jgi:hypothetical protein
MMLGEECESATYWKNCGDEAIANGVKGIIIMVRFLRTQTQLSGSGRLIADTASSGSTLGCPQRQDSGRH